MGRGGVMVEGESFYRTYSVSPIDGKPNDGE